MNDKLLSSKAIFDSIKHIDENGKEYWEARELQKALEYTEWRKFSKVIDKAKKACKTNNSNVSYQFVDINKPITGGKGNIQYVNDYKLSRYACYLIAMNGDPRKKVIAEAQNYFAVQTRKQELTEEEYNRLSEEDKRLYRRRQTKDGNKILYGIAKRKGVKNFDKFTNAGYKGLYNGETADDIFKRKKLNYREDILDNMNSAELGSNVFRITETEELLNMQEEISEEKANETHFRVGKVVRKAIKELGGIMPEDQETPKKSLKIIEKERDITSLNDINFEEKLIEDKVKEKELEITIKMLKDKLDIEMISKYTGLSKEEIKKIRKEK